MTKTSKPNENLRDVDRAIIHAVMFECGILPMEKTNLDMRRALQQLSTEDARALKRKFRKLWRKAMRMQAGHGRTKDMRIEQAKRKLGVGKHAPSRAERAARKELVFKMLWEQLIEPLIKRFDNPDTAQGASLKESKKQNKTS